MKSYILKFLVVFLLSISQYNLAQVEPFLGEIKIFSGGYAPKGWAFCNGQLLPINQNQALYSLLGTMYGGNGTTNFALPDLRGRVPVGMDNSNVIGARDGVEYNTLQVSNLPSHTHTINAVNGAANQNFPTSGLPADSGQLDLEYSSVNPTGVMASSMVSNTGNNTPVPNIQPSIGTTYIIALQGIYPSRN